MTSGNSVASSPGGVILAMVMVAAVFAGCATPVGVRRMDAPEANRKLTESVLAGESLSAPTMQILNRSGLSEKFGDEPAEVIAALHKGLPTARESDRLFALAELSFLHATRSRERSYFRAAAVYAYAFLFPLQPLDAPDPFDPRLRTAVELYNQGLAEGLSENEPRRVVLASGTYRLPFGELVVRIEPEEFRWGPFELTDFVAASGLAVRGLRNDYRWPGVGLPLVGSLQHVKGEEERAYARVPSSLKVATTAFLRMADIENGLRNGRVTADLSLYTVHESVSVDVNGRPAPLEYRPTAALAYTLEGSQVYALELKGLLTGDLALFKQTARFKDNVFLMSPYRPGRIPVVFVHGTASSPARWAEMLNEIVNDRELWNSYQVWLFTYNTGNPILYSAGILTQGLRNVVQELDPEGKDEALRKMVVIGHSQGGMLTKMAAIHSGSRFWDNTFKVPIDQLEVSPETRELLKRSLYYEPLPFVRRVVFIATPHSGSFLVGDRVGDLLRKLISLPFVMLSPLQEVFERSPDAVANRSLMDDIPRSTDNMNPNSPFIKTYSSIPIAPGITAHSIIAVANPADPKARWNDGVVAYTSAHLEGAASELIVHSDHSTQETPHTIEEVRRILLENLKAP
ncbi:MAG: alpha/beta fold hydrolase [Desulfobacterales bacterium]|nr:alpha/beta fold hydrolase [Desulfobacterales bacterium]